MEWVFEKMGANFIDEQVAKNGSYGLKQVMRASKMAATYAENDGLHPVQEEHGEFRYRVQQGLRAACVGREDAAATLILMQTALDNQRTIKRLLWVGVLLLAWIAYRLS